MVLCGTKFCERIESRLREIYELIGTEIDRSNYRHVIASGVVITGGSSIMPGADELASEILKFPTRVGFPEDVAGLTETVYSPMYATGVGLLRYGLSNGEESYVPQFAVDASMFNRVSRRMREWVQDIF